MKKTSVLVLTAIVFAGICWAQTSESAQSAAASQNTSVSADKSGAQGNFQTDANASQKAKASLPGEHGQASTANQLAAGSTVQAELTKPVDVRKNKPGDAVIAKTTQDVKSDGHVVLPKGSKIVGR